jgi:hypothetical protein
MPGPLGLVPLLHDPSPSRERVDGELEQPVGHHHAVGQPATLPEYMLLASQLESKA